MMNEGESSACPHCSELIAPGASLCRFCQRGLDPAQFAPCPMCLEMVRRGAAICRFCTSAISFNDDSETSSSTSGAHNDFLHPGNSSANNPKDAPHVKGPLGKDQLGTGKDGAGKDNISREGGLPKFYLPQIGKLFKPQKDSPPRDDRLHSSPYGAGVREQVLEVIVRQALAGAPWREICAGPMQVNNITPQEVEAEVRRRMGQVADIDECDNNTIDHNMLKCEKLIKRLMRIADDIGGGHNQIQRQIMAEDIRTLVKQLTSSIEALKEQADNHALTNAILQNEVDMYGTKYDAILDLLNARDKIIEALTIKLTEFAAQDKTAKDCQTNEVPSNEVEENDDQANDVPLNEP
jgi:RNA polymerase subunit RPABC4/transcription elongation factor Spt4